MTPLERAEKAQALQSDPVFRAVLADLRNGLIEQLESSAMSDLDTQHEIALSLQLLKQIPARLTKYANELVIDKQREKHDSWVKKMTQRYRP